MEIWSGQDSTRIMPPHFGEMPIVDLLSTNQHFTRYPEDLSYAALMNMKCLRVGVPWHRIEPQPGSYDWDWLDSYMRELQMYGIEPILDPLHHTSFPDWLEGGFSNPDFGAAYCHFFMKLMKRYPWVTKFTIVNEPLVTCLFTGKFGIWYPFHKGDISFLEQLLVVARVIRALSHELKKVGKEHYWTDSCESHINRDGTHNPGQLDRFLLLDILLGKMTTGHPLWNYVCQVVDEYELFSFYKDPMFITAMGLDYYPHSEFEYVNGHRVDNDNPRGFCAVAMDYVNRYGVDVWLAETNIRGEIMDRLKWFNHMLTQCKLLEGALLGIATRFIAFCWYPLIDTTDWHLLVRESDGQLDPQGIIWIDNDEWKERHFIGNPLAEYIYELNRGSLVTWDFAFPYQQPLDKQLAGFVAMEKRPWATVIGDPPYKTNPLYDEIKKDEFSGMA